MRKVTAAVLLAVVIAAVAVPALAASPPTANTVKVLDYRFAPKKLTVKRGTKVTWNWVAGSGIRHDVAVVSGPSKFHSKKQSSGSYSHLFSKKGTYKLVCTIHKSLGMKMTVTVS